MPGFGWLVRMVFLAASGWMIKQGYGDEQLFNELWGIGLFTFTAGWSFIRTRQDKLSVPDEVKVKLDQLHSELEAASKLK